MSELPDTPNPENVFRQNAELSVSPELESPKTIALVFGQGPIKPVLLETELTKDQRKQWELFKNLQQENLETGSLTPVEYHYELSEPDFRVIDSQTYIAKLEHITDAEREQLRIRWQNEPHLALQRYGRVVALAAGAALLYGKIDKAIISGGRTIPRWAKKEGDYPLPQARLSNWPTEAGLMKQLIVKVFGDRYLKMHGIPIEHVIDLEENAPTTIHNVAHVLDKYKKQLSSAHHIFTLTTNAHEERAFTITDLMSEGKKPIASYPAESNLEARADMKDKGFYEALLKHLHDPEHNWVAKLRAQKEDTYTDELVDPRVLAVWELSGKVLPDLHDIINRIVKEETPWKEKAGPIFAEFGMDIEDKIAGLHLLQLLSEQPKTYAELQKRIIELNHEFPSQYGSGTNSEIAAKHNVK